MNHLSTAEARKHFSDMVNQVSYAKERIVLNRHGQNVAAVIPLEDLALLEALEDEIDLKQALEAKRDMKGKKWISWEQLKKEEGL